MPSGLAKEPIRSNSYSRSTYSAFLKRFDKLETAAELVINRGKRASPKRFFPKSKNNKGARPRLRSRQGRKSDALPSSALHPGFRLGILLVSFHRSHLRDGLCNTTEFTSGLLSRHRVLLPTGPDYPEACHFGSPVENVSNSDPQTSLPLISFRVSAFRQSSF